MDYDNSIRGFLIDRKIENLYHFTNLKNLRNILQNGLLSRSTLDAKNIAYYYNDEFRYDGKRDTISCSIGFPNYKIFYKHRQQQKMDWIVIEISSEVLYKKDCMYYKSNAANSELSFTPDVKHGLKGLQQLFTDNDQITRSELRISKDLPTDPQAEVLVSDLIELHYLKRIIFDDDLLVKKYKGNVPIPVCLDRKLFKPRSDFKFWR